MAYSTKSRESAEICQALDWRHDTAPIKTLSRGGRVYVTGTLLKPEEWRALRQRLPSRMADGREIQLVGYPPRAG